MCACRWTDHFPYRKGRRWAHCFTTCMSTHVSESQANLVEGESPVLGSQQVFDGIFLGSRKDLRSACQAAASYPVFFNNIRGTPRRLVPCVQRTTTATCVLCMQIFLFQSARLHPSRVELTSEISVELARVGYTLGCIGCETAKNQSISRDHTEQCRTRIIQAFFSDVVFRV